jgi:hypothetical protein
MEKRQHAAEPVTKEMSAQRDKVQDELDAILLNFDSLAKNYLENILKLQAKLVALKSGKLLKGATGSSAPRGRSVQVDAYKAIHNCFALQIAKLKDRGRFWQHLETLLALPDVEMLEYDQQAKNSRHNPIAIDQTSSKSMEILDARMDDIKSNQGGVIYTTHKFKFTV